MAAVARKRERAEGGGVNEKWGENHQGMGTEEWSGGGGRDGGTREAAAAPAAARCPSAFAKFQRRAHNRSEAARRKKSSHPLIGSVLYGADQVNFARRLGSESGL